jgi:hypothetical protein
VTPQLTPWCKILIEKFGVTQEGKNFRPIIQPQRSKPWFTRQFLHSLIPLNIFSLMRHLYINLPPMPRSHKWSPSIQISQYIFYTHFSSLMRILCPAHPILRDLIAFVNGTNYEASHYTIFSIFLCLWSKYFHMHTILKHPNLSPSLNVMDQVSHLHNT